MKAALTALAWIFGWVAVALLVSGCDTLMRASATSLKTAHSDSLSVSWTIPW